MEKEVKMGWEGKAVKAEANHLDVGLQNINAQVKVSVVCTVGSMICHWVRFKSWPTRWLRKVTPHMRRLAKIPA